MLVFKKVFTFYDILWKRKQSIRQGKTNVAPQLLWFHTLEAPDLICRFVGNHDRNEYLISCSALFGDTAGITDLSWESLKGVSK